MKVSLHIDSPAILFAISEDLQATLAASVSIGQHMPGESCLMTHSEVDAAFVSQFYGVISPMKVKHVVDDGLSPLEVRLILNVEEGLRQTSLGISSDNPALIDELTTSCLGPLGVVAGAPSLRVVSENTITAQHDNVAVQTIQWWLKRRGIVTRLSQSFFSESGLAIKEYRPEYADIRPRMPLTIHTDNMLAGQALLELLEQSGFLVAGVVHKDFGDQGDDRLGVKSPWFGLESSRREKVDLANVISQFARDHGIQLDAYPVTLEHELSSNTMSDVFLPFDACRDRRMCAYGGPYPDRLSARIETDSPEAGKRLERRLQALGIRKIKVANIDEDDLKKGHCLYAGELPLFSTIKEQICLEIREELDSMSGHAFPIRSRDNTVSSDDMVIRFPAIGIEDGTLLEFMSSPRHFNLTVRCEDKNGWKDCINELQGMGFAQFGVKTEENSEKLLKYGMASEGVRKLVGEVVARHGVPDLREEKAWDDDDNDLWVYLPMKAEGVEAKQQKELALQKTNTQLYWEQERLAGVRALVIGLRETRVPCDSRWAHLVPHKEQFRHYCLTNRTLGIMRYVLKRVEMGEPCLLEGGAATSKTSAILFLAAMLGQPVVRINLNGQTDTGELIGKFVPDTESKQGMGWKWQEGISLAMRHGFWVVLDEMNLADPQVLERLNSVLEMPPSLVISEYDNSVVGGGACPVHPNFRILATMNPPSFVGRNQLSRAYESRWVGTLRIPDPEEAEYCQILKTAIFGGLRWGYAHLDDARKAPACASLQALPNIEQVCHDLGKFHHLVARGEKDKGAVSLRKLLALAHYLVGADPASFRSRIRDGIFDYYIGSARSPEDSQAISLLAKSCNLQEVA